MGQKDRRRIAIWARGNSLICLNHFGDCRIKNGHKLAFHLALDQFYNAKERNKYSISLEKWLPMASTNLGISRPIAFAIFQGAVAATKCAYYKSQTNDQHFVPLPFICSTIVLMEADENEQNNIVEFIRKNAALFCFFFVFSELALPSIKCHKNWAEFLCLNGQIAIPQNGLAQLDLFFEGANLLDMDQQSIENSEAPYIHAKPLSILLKEIGENRKRQNFCLSELANLMEEYLQPDLFQLDRIGCPQDISAIGRPRSLTAAASSRRRRLQFQNWQRMELLSSSGLRGGNLRLFQAGPNASPIFHPLALESVVISCCESTGPIMLGPVRCILLLRNVKNMVISAISSNIRLHNCEDLTLFCQTESIILGAKCANIRLAPYNAFYNGLEFELAYAGMRLFGTTRNDHSFSWARTIRLNSAHNCANFSPTICHLLGPEHFYLQPTPFPTNSDSDFHKSFLNSIPTIYLKCWLHAEETAQKQAEKMNEKQLNELCPLKRRDLAYLLRKIKRD